MPRCRDAAASGHRRSGAGRRRAPDGAPSPGAVGCRARGYSPVKGQPVPRAWCSFGRRAAGVPGGGRRRGRSAALAVALSGAGRRAAAGSGNGRRRDDAGGPGTARWVTGLSVVRAGPGSAHARSRRPTGPNRAPPSIGGTLLNWGNTNRHGLERAGARSSTPHGGLQARCRPDQNGIRGKGVQKTPDCRASGEAVGWRRPGYRPCAGFRVATDPFSTTRSDDRRCKWDPTASRGGIRHRIRFWYGRHRALARFRGALRGVRGSHAPSNRAIRAGGGQCSTGAAGARRVPLRQRTRPPTALPQGPRPFVVAAFHPAPRCPVSRRSARSGAPLCRRRPLPRPAPTRRSARSRERGTRCAVLGRPREPRSPVRGPWAPDRVGASSARGRPSRHRRRRCRRLRWRRPPRPCPRPRWRPRRCPGLRRALRGRRPPRFRTAS